MNTQNVFISGVVALAVAVSCIFAFYPSEKIATDDTPSAGYSQVDVGNFPEGIQNGAVAERYYAISIPAGQAQWSYRNTSGRTQFVTLGLLRTTGTASTTQTLTMGTSTSSTFNGLSVPATVKTFLNFVVPTSSLATTTNTMQGVGATSAAGAGVATLADGEYLNVGIYQTFQQANCNGAACERATSTNRGFNVTGFIKVVQP